MSIDIRAREKGLAGELSNFYVRPFVFDGVRCSSMEGFLQSLKYEDVTQQKIVASLPGPLAYTTGRSAPDWRPLQILYWQGDVFCRHSDEYIELISQAFDAQFDQDETLKATLLKTVGQELRHSVGKTNPNQTILTEREFIYQLDRLRWRALGQ